MSEIAAQIKQGQRMLWSSGDWDAMAALVDMVGTELLDRVGVQPGMDLLDVGCGTGGSVAIPAALRGARVTGCDLTPEHFPRARRRAEEAGVEVEWLEADAEALPFADASFDRVLSTFGHMFAPRHEVAAAQLARVVRPGGAIALATWLPDSLPSALLRGMSGDAALPPGVRSPLEWGERGHALAMLEPHGLEISFDEATAPAAFEDLDAAIGFYERNFGGLALMRGVLEPERYAEKVALLRGIIADADEAPGDEVRFEAGYLVTIARREG